MGRIEKRAHMGTVTTDFTMVQAGSLLNANGGFLIMDMESLLMNPYVWEALKRTLQTKCLYIEDITEETGFGTVSLRPEPIPLEVKVILLGSYDNFEVLQNHDRRFNKIFKVRADFDSEVQKSRTRFSNMRGLLPGFARRRVYCLSHPKVWPPLWSTEKNTYPTKTSFQFDSVLCWEY